MKAFTAEDGDGDRIEAEPPGGCTPDLMVSVNGEAMLLGPEQVVEFRWWLSEVFDPTPPEQRAPKGEDPALPQGVSDADKLRLLADVVDAQAPFGTDLADFKRRLQIVLGL